MKIRLVLIAVFASLNIYYISKMLNRENEPELIMNEEDVLKEQPKKKNKEQSVIKESKSSSNQMPDNQPTRREDDEKQTNQNITVVSNLDESTRRELEVSLKTYKSVVHIPVGNALLYYQKNSADPVSNSFKPNENFTPSTTSNFSLYSKSKKLYHILNEDPIELEIQLSDGKKVVKANILKAQLLNEENKLVANLKFTPDKDLMYRASFNLKDNSKYNMEGNYMVKLSVSPSDANDVKSEVVHTIIQFSVVKRYATFLGKAKSGVNSNGDLQFDLLYKIYEAGQYQFEGALYTLDGKLIGHIEDRVSLEPSNMQNLSLIFHGSILRNNQISGPYILKTVSLNKVNKDYTVSRSKQDKVNIQTEPLSPESFTSKTYVDPIVAKKIKHLEEILNN